MCNEKKKKKKELKKRFMGALRWLHSKDNTKEKEKKKKKVRRPHMSWTHVTSTSQARAANATAPAIAATGARKSAATPVNWTGALAAVVVANSVTGFSVTALETGSVTITGFSVRVLVMVPETVT